MYKYELHAHTHECDPYALLSGCELAHLYKEAGYDGIVITDHYFDMFFSQWCAGELEGASQMQQMQRWLKGFLSAREAGERIGITVLPGAEVRLDHCPNDYLIYGISEDFFYTAPRLDKQKSLEALLALMPEGVCVVQAHPFRDGMSVQSPKGLFGMEVYNGGTERFRNQLACSFAEHYQLAKTSGSDIHHISALAKGGIMTDRRICTPNDLSSVLRSGEYRLIEKV